ncbi:OPT family oligopeptide transporter [Mesoterricola sediminis]|uniref:Peptide transporter n=1 Tax=Mesoterricola sediminis TaxID=2927980 RepID=A0AA48KGV7_9BACT|nr:oligopeptide transporter, OPT family [Mesoterricola sediminis]BDU77783.1 peptide transporter [Mesoterricola sediminis]
MSSSDESTAIKGLPENYRRVLEPGEEYVPLVPQDGVPEVTLRSVLYGILFCAVFSMAAAYLALRVGQGIEAAIPISILAIGISRFYARRSSILENVIITSIGANSGHVVAGAVFTIPALYMLAAVPGSSVPTPHMWQVVLVSFLGGSLGILFFIPLRHNFMVDNHGVFPWPEATATAEILASGESAGNQAKVLAGSALLGMAYDGFSALFRGMSETITLVHAGVGAFLRRQFMAFNMLNSAATMSIGYIIGLRYSAVIAAGSVLSTFVLVPMIHAIGQHVPVTLPPGALPIAQMSPEQIFKAYVRIIGIGAIAGAGIMGVLAGMPGMIRSIGKNLAGLKSAEKVEKGIAPRTHRTLPNSFVAMGLLVFALAAFLFFSFGLGMKSAVFAAFMGTGVVMAIAFLFAPVAARAIATIGTNPISGMTMLTLIITGLVMVKLGYAGGVGMFITLMVGGVVCTALSASGAFATDLKIGHWIGATPAKQMGLKFMGTFVAAVFTGLAMWGMAHQGFGTAAVPAPQASAMREILDGIFGTTAMPLRWFLFSLGVVLSLVLRMVELPALGFALGMYLPIEVNSPLLLGGVLAWIVNRRKTGDSDALAKARENRGILVASGLMAGGGIMGVIASFVKIKWKEGFPILSAASAEGATGEWLAIAAMTALCIFTVVYSRAAKATE